METFRIKTESLITSNRVSDVLCSAFEGGSNYWAEVVSKRKPKAWPNTPESERGYSFNYPLNPGGVVVIRAKEDGPTLYRLTYKSIKRGLQLMASEHGSEFADIISEHDDAGTADTLLQLCLFGKVVYG